MPHSLYLHIPFCRHRCAYCDFNTYAGLEALVEPYMAALEAEVHSLAGQTPGSVHTIFFGGGTPSLVPLPLLESLLAHVRAGFDVEPDAEITLEANPGTVSPAYLQGLRALGVNRLSMGMQSAAPEDLRVLERSHDFFDVVNAVTWARRAGFDNLNLDLIFGLPGQSPDRWSWTLDRAIDLHPDHFSIYNLIFEHGTPMNAWLERGLLTVPDEDEAAEMYEHSQARLAGAGYTQYEISNFARPDSSGAPLACRHNLQYWRSLPYLGLGAGAHGFAGGVRTVNVRAPQAYIARMRQSPEPHRFPRTAATVHARTVSRTDAMSETMITGLRLVQEGVSDAEFFTRFGICLDDAFPEQIRSLTAQGLLEWRGTALRLTPRGVLLGNRVFMEFVS